MPSIKGLKMRWESTKRFKRRRQSNYKSKRKSKAVKRKKHLKFSIRIIRMSKNKITTTLFFLMEALLELKGDLRIARWLLSNARSKILTTYWKDWFRKLPKARCHQSSRPNLLKTTSSLHWFTRCILLKIHPNVVLYLFSWKPIL